MREIVLDTETTGLSPKEGHRIIEIGAVEIINKIRTGETFHVYINPEVEISAGAFRVHGISNEFLSDKPKFDAVVSDFKDFIQDSKLIAHNAPFDMGFINHHLRQLKLPAILDDLVIDSLAIARRKYPGQKNSLDALCSRLNVDSSNRVLHGALLDAELLADVYAEMMGVGANQRNLMFVAQEEEKTEEHVTPILHFGNNSKTYEARDFEITSEEKQAHKEFVEKLPNSVWENA